MKTYYAMVTPGRCGDWGNVILIDSRIGDFLEEALNTWDDDGIEDFKAMFLSSTWNFAKEQLNSLDMEDTQFVESISNNWCNIMSDNYYELLKLNSTIEFKSITTLINYVQENNIKVIDDLH